jgi:AraC-like DNA-binding protein
MYPYLCPVGVAAYETSWSVGTAMNERQRPTAAPANPEGKRFRTTDFAQRDRLEAWREIIGRAVMKVEIERIPDTQYFSDFTLRMLPDLCMSSGAVTGLRFRRPPALIDNDDLVLQISLSGGFRAHQREFELGDGQAVLMSSDQTGMVSFIDESFLLFRIPLRVMSPTIGDLDAVLYRPIPKDNEALRLLAYYAGAIRGMPGFGDPGARHLAATHIRDLIALALGATRDATEIANGRGLRAARLSAIKADIAGRAARPDLSIGEVALRQRVTSRYVQMLFEAEGTTFSEFVLNTRLMRAYQMLTDPRLAKRPIISVALDTGFQDLSYFNRTFRRRFGGTPSEMRAAARGR